MIQTLMNSYGAYLANKAVERPDLITMSAKGRSPNSTDKFAPDLKAIASEAYARAIDDAARVTMDRARPDAIRLAAGELTAKEMRMVQAVLNGLVVSIISLKG